MVPALTQRCRSGIFVGKVSPAKLRRIGVVTLVVATAVLALAYLVVARVPLGEAPPTGSHDAGADTCRELAGRYRTALSELENCRGDDQCAIEPRGRWWFALDGCFRAFNRTRSRAPADALADRWLERGCATDTEVCPVPRKAVCEAGRCVMRPPAGVPRRWRRQVIARALSFYLPPELTAADVRSIDSAARRYDGEGVQIHVDYGDAVRRSADDDVAHLLPPIVQSLDERQVLVDGRAARSFRYELRPVTGGGGEPDPVLRHGRLLYLHDAPSRCLYRAPCLGVSEPALEIRVECADREDCGMADTLFRSISFW